MLGFGIGKLTTLRSILQARYHSLDWTGQPSSRIQANHIEGCPRRSMSISTLLKVRMKLQESSSNDRRHHTFIDARNHLDEETLLKRAPQSIR